MKGILQNYPILIQYYPTLVSSDYKMNNIGYFRCSKIAKGVFYLYKSGIQI